MNENKPKKLIRGQWIKNVYIYIYIHLLFNIYYIYVGSIAFDLRNHTCACYRFHESFCSDLKLHQETFVIATLVNDIMMSARSDLFILDLADEIEKRDKEAGVPGMVPHTTRKFMICIRIKIK